MVPDDTALRDAVIDETHRCGHLGMDATLSLKHHYFWKHGGLSMRQHVEAFVRSCDACQRNKSDRKPGGLLQPMSLAEGPWTSFGVDFVDALPLTKHGNNRLMVVVDRFTKAVHIISTHDRLTAEGCAMLIYREVYRLHGIPDVFVSDRDTLFTSKFFVEFQRLLGTKQRMSTAFHPQTDGQTKRANRVIGEVLRKSLRFGAR